MIELVDSHAHIQEPEFAADIDAALERARAAGVTTVIVPAEDVDSSRRAVALASRIDGVYATAGFHPHEASKLDDAALAQIEALLSHEKVVAVGEIGLDFYRTLSPRERQIEAFEVQLNLAERHALPVVIHCRDAWDALADQLPAWAHRVAPAYAGRPLGVLHYYSSDLETALRYVDLGFLISIHTSVTHPKATALREVVAALPLTSLVVETDSPYGAPQAHRGKRNEPAYVIEAVRQIAELKDLSMEEVATTASANALRLFRLAAPAEAVLKGVEP
ncbi:MAG: YchF/TatD family DNA exonuclease [Dehalococcoidia bacterium]|nr:YchF/TatD family DNA exonuclease [Dehalococcoidia bacterium]